MESEGAQGRCPCCGRVQTAIDRDSHEPLIYKYTAQNNSEALCGLLNSGTDPNAFMLMDVSMVCPLHRAAECNAVACAQALLAHGACINARDSQGRTPLHIVGITQAAEFGHLNFIKFLLSKDADRLCARNCRKCKMYCKLASRPEKKPQPTPACQEVVEYSSSDEEHDFVTHLKKLSLILQGKVINRAGQIVPFK